MTWQQALATDDRRIETLFADDKDRLTKLTVQEAGIRFDFSKTHLTAERVTAFTALAEEANLSAARDKLYSGGIVNPSENRPAEHGAERGSGNPQAVEKAAAAHARMRALIDAIEAEALGPIRQVIHIGIGGSALGPSLLVDALGRKAARYEVAVVSNVDGAALEEVFERFDPQATLVVVASKTFTTAETMLNAQSAISWLLEGGVEDPYGQMVALTAEPDKAVAFGIDETRVLPFSVNVGGRYSLWSTIGFPAALALGWDAFEQLLEGAAQMDRHFRYTAADKNAPMLAAFADLYYTQARGVETRGIFAYDERLRLLPSYLQQLEMESNGKSVKLDGSPVGRPTAAIAWGGVGTDAQHAVFQLLHQGTHLVPVEFLAVVEQGHTLDPAHHKQLLANCFAQGAALMKGRKSDDGARNFPGDRPSTTLLLDQLDPATLGALIAYYEARVFTNAVLLGINPFDQWGVELGKEMAHSIGAQIDGEGDAEFDPSTAALIEKAFG